MRGFIGDKGQGAVEYIFTYSWAIVVLIVLGVFMWQLGIFEGGQTPMITSGFVRIKPQSSGTGLSEDGVFTGTFVNGMGARAYVKGVKIYNADTGQLICCSHSIPGECAVAGVTGAASAIGGRDHAYFDSGGTVELKAGENIEFELGRGAAHIPAGTALSSCLIGGADEGKKYNIRVEIEYDVEFGGVRGTHKEQGFISGPFE